ncbi:winged helix-turn-helix transcriptional regulator [Acinetobacter shaoyimingii]|uniref:winged helix-turn-helix transcriptional regulator n=1 Tax=Acinetobacter shaoyimingii TaxID=2715164 RepID=UPI00148FFD66|nr:helix-turn-helix domain-containing protein [Acinetobacter shaoyimingii]
MQFKQNVIFCINSEAIEIRTDDHEYFAGKFFLLFSGKWSLPILRYLFIANAPIRFNKIHRDLSPITQMQLSKYLKALERLNLVEKKSYAEIPPRVEYSITDLGKSLDQPLAELSNWMKQHDNFFK